MNKAPWWVGPLFLGGMLVGVPIFIWVGIWVIMSYLDLLLWIGKQVPWPI